MGTAIPGTVTQAQAQAQAQAAAILVLAHEARVQGRPGEALQLADQALQRHEHPSVRFARAQALRDLDRLDEALSECDYALAYEPQDVSIHAERGTTLIAMGRLDEAMAALDRALALNPRHVHAMTVRGNLLIELGMPLAARDQMEVVLAIAPNDLMARWNRALLSLHLGDFGRGWKEYEVRWLEPSWKVQLPSSRPMWQGEALREASTLLLHCEQGLGDTLQFCRLATDAALATRARIVLVVPPALQRLLAGLRGADQVCAVGQKLPPFDSWCMLMSLPRALGLRDVPAWSGPYISAPVQSLQDWRARLPPTDAPRVGLVWRGNPKHVRDAKRSMRLPELLEALPHGPQYLSLQQKFADGERELLATRPDILDLGSGLEDFTDTAALCALCDLVITVDTSVAHLAGAMGRPAWVLSAFAADWRWQVNRSDSPWYPSVRLFRQDRPLHWGGLLRRLGFELRAWLASRGGTTS